MCVRACYVLLKGLSSFMASQAGTCAGKKERREAYQSPILVACSRWLSTRSFYMWHIFTFNHICSWTIWKQMIWADIKLHLADMIALLAVHNVDMHLLHALAFPHVINMTIFFVISSPHWTR